MISQVSIKLVSYAEQASPSINLFRNPEDMLSCDEAHIFEQPHKNLWGFQPGQTQTMQAVQPQKMARGLKIRK